MRQCVEIGIFLFRLSLSLDRIDSIWQEQCGLTECLHDTYICCDVSVQSAYCDEHYYNYRYHQYQWTHFQTPDTTQRTSKWQQMHDIKSGSNKISLISVNYIVNYIVVKIRQFSNVICSILLFFFLSFSSKFQSNNNRENEKKWHV